MEAGRGKVLGSGAGVNAAFLPHPKSFSADCLLPWIAEGMGAGKSIYLLALTLPRSLGPLKGTEGTPAPLATLVCLKPDPDTQMGCLGLQPETCRSHEHTRQMYLSMSSEEASQIYYFPLVRPSEPNDRSFCQKEPSILFLQSKPCSACPSVLVRAGIPPVTSSIS